MLSTFLKLCGWIQDKPTFAVSLILIFALLLYAYGCESKTDSLIHPATKVTRVELQTELETLLTLGEARFSDLDRQDDLKQLVFNNALVIAQGGDVNPLGVLTTLAAIFGVGATADDIRLRKQRRKNLQNYIDLQKSANPT